RASRWAGVHQLSQPCLRERMFMDMLTAKDIRSIRIFLKLNPTDFASRLRVSEKTVRRWEIGDRRPRYEKMEEINKLLEAEGVKLSDVNGTNGHTAAAAIP